MKKFLRLLSLLGLAALVISPVRASDDDDYLSDDDDDYLVGEALTPEQELRIEQAEKAAESAAKLAQRSAKSSAAAAERAARRAPKLVRDAVKAQGKYLVELASLTDETSFVQSLTSLAEEYAIDLSGLPTVDELLAYERDEALADAAFYRSLIPLSPADRAAALAARSSDDDDDDDDDSDDSADGLSEFQGVVFEAIEELAEELADVADAYAEWQDKLALSALSPSDYSAEMARRAAVASARRAELAALPRSSQVWLRKAWSAEEDAAEYTAALEFDILR